MFTEDFNFILLLIGLFIIPRMLQRFRLPNAITCFALGVGSVFYHPPFVGDPTLKLFAMLGISTLFLFAGLEIDFRELGRETSILIQHVAIWILFIIFVTSALKLGFKIPVQPALLIALGLVTPSCGFILDNLKKFRLQEKEIFWIKGNAISTEIVALIFLFFATQSAQISSLVQSLFTLGMVALGLPVLFKIFALFVLPFAPNSEFAFLMVSAVSCAFITKKMGVYYLLGAFLTGVVAQRFRESLPAISSEKLFHSLESFATIFVPFYFFNAGCRIGSQSFSVTSLYHGIAFFVFLVPLRMGVICLHRKIALGESIGHSSRIALMIQPTLVFTFVTIELLKVVKFNDPQILTGLSLYAVATTFLPILFLGAPLPQYESPVIIPPTAEMEHQLMESKESGEEKR